MRTTRITTALLLAAVGITLLSWLAPSLTRPKARAQRVNTAKNIVTAPMTAPASPTAPPSRGP